MCESDYGQALEEMRGVVDGLFIVLLDRAFNLHGELIRLRMERQREQQEDEMRSMQQVMKQRED